MSEVLQTNIFFMITSVGVIVLTSLSCVLLYQVIKIVRSVRRIVERVEVGSEVLAEDIEHIRENLNIANLVNFIMRFIPGVTRSSKKRSKD